MIKTIYIEEEIASHPRTKQIIKRNIDYKKKVSKSYPKKSFKLESNIDKTAWRVLFRNEKM